MLKLLRRMQPLYLLVDIFLVGVAFMAPYLLYYNNWGDLFSNPKTPGWEDYALIFMVWGGMIFFSLYRKGLYRTDRELGYGKECGRVVSTVFITCISTVAVIFLIKHKMHSRAVFVSNFAMLCLLLAGWRMVKRFFVRKLVSAGLNNINVLLIGADEVSQLVVDIIRRRPHLGLRIVGYLDDQKEGMIDGIPVIGKLSAFPTVVANRFVDEVIINVSPHEKVVADIIKQASRLRLGVRTIPDELSSQIILATMTPMSEPEPSRVDIGWLGGIPVFTYRAHSLYPSENLLKWLLDMVICSISLAVLSPLFLTIAVLIKLSSRGPIFFVQKRVGRKGTIFNIYKFRSMVRNAEAMKSQLRDHNEATGGVMFKIKEDPRVTRIGRILRRYSLDELPQLFNVLKGDMSLVGPRPPLASELQEYQDQHMYRLLIKPGITGLSQIRGRSDLVFVRWVRWDLWYIEHWSIWLDLRILLETIPSVLRGRGAY